MRKSVGLVVVVVFLGGVACRQTAESKKIPITTSSAEARASYLKARDLSDNVHNAEARPLLDEAIRKDPNFAMAHLLRAETAASPNEFFDQVKAAAAAAGKVSDGEQLLIRAQESYTKGDNKARGECLTKLAAAYPDDERAHWFLGVYRYNMKELDDAVRELQKASQLNPGYGMAYNLLGYALKEAHKEKDAEAAFRKYVELVPNEPNPHDSLAELLMKMGRFDESIASYQKALSLDAKFFSAYRGVAANLMFQEKHEEALEQLQKGFDAAGDDGERRGMLDAMAALNVDWGRLPAALEALTRQSALAEKGGDKVAMAVVASARGDLLLDAGKGEEAKAEFAKARELMRQSTMPEGSKKIFELASHGDLALLAAAKKDFAGAAKEAEVMRAGLEAMGDPNQIRYTHEVLGIVALRQAKYDEAISQLNQADLSSAYTMFQLAKAYAGKKDAANAKKYYEMAANDYTPPGLRYAMVRKAAIKALGK